MELHAPKTARRIYPGVRVVLLMVALLHSTAGKFPVSAQSRGPVAVAPISSTARQNLARTAHLLTSGTADKPRQINILVYGQSISQQDWWKAVREYLMSEYPNTQIVMTNKAIGGFSAERLKLMVADDVLPLSPDLILFHDYGSEQDYEEIIRFLRSRTTAEIAVQNDHFSPHQDNAWHDRHSYEWLPALAEKYGLAMIDVRGAWRRYLDAQALKPDQLLSDHVHLNDHGNYVMAEIVKSYLKFPHVLGTPAESPQIYRMGQDVHFTNGTATLSFVGSRVDLVWESAVPPSAAEIEVRIDGRLVSESLGCWYHTRPGEGLIGSGWPPRMGMPVSVDLAGQPSEEKWSLTITRADSLGRSVEFDLAGSQTGFDGSGSSTVPFTSSSGTIAIRPEQWFTRKNPGDFSFLPTIQVGDKIELTVHSMCRDRVRRSEGAEFITVVQGLSNTQHTLELIARDGSAHLHAVRVFRPPLMH